PVTEAAMPAPPFIRVTALIRQMLAQQQAVAGDGLAALEQAQASPQAHRVVGEYGLAEFALEPLAHAHGRPVAARHDDGLGIRSVGAAPKLVGRLRPGTAK